jgi:D-alanyl-D-alanine carboxypeptidase/D-alanyl-D-alanine-endopeptidase (penicillin-binding protein 4)
VRQVTSTSRRIRWAGASICLAVLCSACGGGPATGKPTTATSPGSVPAATSGTAAPVQPTGQDIGSGADPNTDGAVTETGDTFLAAVGSTAQLPTTQGIEAVLAPLLKASALGKRVSAIVLDAATGHQLFALNSGRSATPASTTKLLTAVAALAALGPETTFTTSVTTSSTTGDTPIFLVGGGDMLLAAGHGDAQAVNGRAGLADLAATTASALKAAGRVAVTVRLDDTLFTESAAKDWAPTDVSDGYVAPIMPIAVDAGAVKSRPGHYPLRAKDPAISAASAFVRALQAQGIAVNGPVRRAAAPQSGLTTLAKASSAPLDELVEYFLTYSDNTVAEDVARMVAVHQHAPTTFQGAGQSVLKEVQTLGIDITGGALSGGSGLGRTTVLTPTILAQVIEAAAGDKHPELRAAITGMPVAGASGTLVNRFDGAAQQSVLGLIRAKTGTLSGVNTLAGIVVDTDQRLLVFAIMADQTTNAAAAESALDHLAGTLAQCGCR